MIFSKNQTRIMEIFVSQITKRFSIRGVGKSLYMNNSLAHRTIKPLIKDKLLIYDELNFLMLNYKENHQELAYIEHLRSKEFLSKSKNKKLSLFVDEVIDKFPNQNFVLLLYGSTVLNDKPNDIDILFIIEKTEDIELTEKRLYNVCRKYTLKLHTLVVSFESIYEMLITRDQKNIMNEILNKHIIFYGGELFYRLIKNGRR
ncbi:MAG: hypothetical protein ABIG89_05210 [Candidatus Woesearchaeota archaeon]